MEKNITTYKKLLLQKAHDAFKEYQILPCGRTADLEECFTLSGNRLMLWFNTTKDNSTRMLHTVIA
ncbi:MAG: hypothetical protein HQK77_16920 [Desulfobacterales bacterium]|nr:hypothetical protein [Desulfobacterales bacterium]